MTARRIFVASAAAALSIAAVVGDATGGTVQTPAFSPRVDNPWYPLKPGTTYHYRGAKDGRSAVDVMTVTHRTRIVDGASCVVVEDRLFLGGRLEERTTEWYAQDTRGNVWYFGEDTAELDARGRVKNTDGTWRAGRNGARPGIFMFAKPRIGRSAQQEFYRGQAEDHFRVLSLNARVSVPYVSSRSALLTREWTPLEPGTIDHKLYVRGIGTVLEQTVKGGTERAALVSVTRS